MPKKVHHKTFPRRLIKATTRLRIPTLTLFYLLLVLFSKTTWVSAAEALPFLLFGFLFRLVCTGTIQKDEELMTSGVYHYLRHPLYLANFSIGMGFSILSHLPLALPIFLGITVLFYLPTIWLEEKVLEELFGEQYLRYAQNTPRLFPRSLPRKIWHPFSWKLVRKNYEPQGILSQLLLALLMLLKPFL